MEKLQEKSSIFYTENFTEHFLYLQFSIILNDFVDYWSYWRIRF